MAQQLVERLLQAGSGVAVALHHMGREPGGDESEVVLHIIEEVEGMGQVGGAVIDAGEHMAVDVGLALQYARLDETVLEREHFFAAFGRLKITASR